MCFSLATSVAFSVAGGGLTAYAFYSPTVRPTGFAYLVLFYTGMEVLQTLQYHDLNRCGQLTNRALTEVGFVLVLVQPLLWNAFFRRNVELAVRPAFTLAMILSLIWMCGFSMRRFVGAENQNFEIGSSGEGGQGACTQTSPTAFHVAWTWPLGSMNGLEANWLFYLCAWFVPAAAFYNTPEPHFPRVSRGALYVSMLSGGLITSCVASRNYLHAIPSTWCLFSIPSLCVPLSLAAYSDYLRLSPPAAQSNTHSGPENSKWILESDPLLNSAV